MKKAYLIIIPLSLFVVGVFFTFNSVSAQALANKLKGRILIQAQQNGEAWYVNPENEKRYYLGRPNDAFNIMRELGIGITNKNLEKIEIATTNLAGLDILSRGSDNDSDGLSNAIEDSLNTDKNSFDTDGDGYNDKQELLNLYNPNGVGKIVIDNNFAAGQAGKILLQVERNGEAWYVSPGNNKRYFLGKPLDAFNLMRELGQGITDYDIRKIPANISTGDFKKYDNLEYNFTFEYVNFWPNSFRSTIENVDFNKNDFNSQYELKKIFEYKLSPTATSSDDWLRVKIRIYKNNNYDLTNFIEGVFAFEHSDCVENECDSIKSLDNYTNGSLSGKLVNIGNLFESTEKIYLFQTSDYIYYINVESDQTDKNEGSEKILQTFNTLD